MSIYAQKNYGQKLGASDETIAESGALLTAFSNLLSRFGTDISPEELSEKLVSLGVDPTKLTWGHVSMIDPNVALYAIGQGAPEYSDSIVKLQYTSLLTKELATTYAIVLDAKAGTIIDSFDGTEKDWDVYEGPKAFFTFAKYPEYVPTSLRVPVATAEEKPAAEPETLDLSKDDVDLEGGIYADTVPVRKISKEDKWKVSFVRGLGPIETIAIQDATIKDLEDLQTDVDLKAGTLVYVGGRFEKDGVAYYRTVDSVSKDHWYGIPAGVLKKTEAQNEEELDHLLDDINMELPTTKSGLSTHDKVIKGAATAEGKILGIFKRKKKDEVTK